MKLFKHVKPGDSLSASEYNRLVDLVTSLSRNFVANSYLDSRGVHIRRLPLFKHGIRSAKIQAGGVPANNTGPFTCKLLDFDGSETGDDIDVYPRSHLGSNNFDSGDVHPSYSAGDDMPVYKDSDGKWYTHNVFEDTINCVCTAP